MKKMLCLLAFVLVAGLASRAPGGIVPPDGTYAGKSPGEWHALWWQWADNTKDKKSPFLQSEGVVDTKGQSGPVWFLAGYFGDWFAPGGGPVEITRQITVPQGTALFFPILNGELTPREWQWGWIIENYPEAETWAAANPDASMLDVIEALGIEDVPDPTLDDLWAMLEGWFTPAEDILPSLFASIDGEPVDLAGYMAPVPEDGFATVLCNTNHVPFYYPHRTALDAVVADGWCLLVTPFDVGTHEIEFAAYFSTPEGGTLGMHITYQITVVAPKKVK